jgi:hypothetical protein
VRPLPLEGKRKPMIGKARDYSRGLRDRGEMWPRCLFKSEFGYSVPGSLMKFFVVLLLATYNFVSIAYAGELTVVDVEVSKDRAAYLRHHYGWFGSRCLPVKKLPTLIVIKAPSQGTMCFVSHLDQIKQSPNQECVGRTLNVINVYYIPNKGFSGADSMSYGLMETKYDYGYNVYVSEDMPDKGRFPISNFEGAEPVLPGHTIKKCPDFLS